MVTAALQLALAVAYPLLAHWATHDGGGPAAALALGDLVLMGLAGALVRRRAWAWAGAVIAALALGLLARTPFAQVLLLAPPALFMGAIAWWFARSLRRPREALITRIVAAIEGCGIADMPPVLYRYSRGLTAAWATLLGALALLNAGLALIAVPGGVLARLGHTPAVAISDAQWSLFANILNYGVIGGFFLGEYALRRFLLPPASYRNFFDFMRKMAALGPGFWRSLFD